jgi:hypothetical protein
MNDDAQLLLIERALRDQAGIVIQPLDERQASVTFDGALRTNRRPRARPGNGELGFRLDGVRRLRKVLACASRSSTPAVRFCWGAC